MHYEEFELGRRIETRPRTVTGTDVDLFTALTGATNPLFTSDEHAQAKGMKGRVVPVPLLLSFAIGLSYQSGLFDHVLALAGIENVRFLSPVSPGQTLEVHAEAVEKRPTKDPGRGIVVLAIEALEAANRTSVLQGRFVFVVSRRYPEVMVA